MKNKKYKKRTIELDFSELTRGDQIKLLIELKSNCGMPINEKYINQLNEFALISQIKHYKTIVTSSLSSS